MRNGSVGTQYETLVDRFLRHPTPICTGMYNVLGNRKYCKSIMAWPEISTVLMISRYYDSDHTQLESYEGRSVG